jgi:LmbE family N-acetylglucosaminyl deacetylase
MKGLRLAEPGQRLSVLCLGAHSDDIEIGAGATILQWQMAGVVLDVHWCVLSATGPREAEARASAADFLKGLQKVRVEAHRFRDSFFPAQSGDIKSWFEDVKGRVQPDVIFTHRGDDAHQDHREVSRLTWNTFRDHLILEYEIPKWDGDLGRPNIYMPISEAAMARKVELLMRHFGTQRSKDWFDEETFRGLARLRAVECRAPDRYAEAFYARKVTLA